MGSLLFWLSCLHPPALGLTDTVLFTWVLGIQTQVLCLFSKSLNHWPTDPHPQPAQCVLSCLILAKLQRLWHQGNEKKQTSGSTKAGETAASLKLSVFQMLSWTGRWWYCILLNKGAGYYIQTLNLVCLWHAWSSGLSCENKVICLSDICFMWLSSSYHLPRFIVWSPNFVFVIMAVAPDFGLTEPMKWYISEMNSEISFSYYMYPIFLKLWT